MYLKGYNVREKGIDVFLDKKQINDLGNLR